MSLSKLSKAKYIAAGFEEDSKKLLESFVQENSSNFTVFTAKWKEMNFGLIFLGRDKEELQIFTNEIFLLTLVYLQTDSIILKIGAVYLLYALYRNQKSDPVVKIRITLKELEILKELKILSEENRYVHLHYIITFLCENAFEFVAESIMLGPCSRGKKKEDPTFIVDDQSEMKNLRNSNILEEIQVMSKDYEESIARVLPNALCCESEIGKYIESLDALINEEHSETTEKNVNDLLGNRRAQIKANQFSKKAIFRQLNASDSEEVDEPVEEEESAPKKLAKKKKRPAKEKRRVGRPRNMDLEKLLESDESDPSPEDKVAKRRGPVPRRSYTDGSFDIKVPDFDHVFNKFMEASDSSDE